MIKEYLVANGKYDYEWKGARCHLCDKKCKSKRGIKSHMRFCYHAQHQKEQDFTGRKAEKAARWEKVCEDQANRPKVTCAGTPLNNVAEFKYLGSMFTGDIELR